MRVEVPEFKRCCFCIPLRYGLLVCGYLKLAMMLLLGLLVTYYLTIFIIIFVHYPYINLMSDIVLAFIFVLLILLDISMTIMFLVGGHQKTVKLLQIFKVYSIVMVCISTLIFIITTSFELYYARQRIRYHDAMVNLGFLFYTKSIAGLFSIGIQVYVILLLRSEINKLKNNRQFRFVNVANEAECAMENGISEQYTKTNDNEIGNSNHSTGNNDRSIGNIDHKIGNYYIKKENENTKTGDYSRDALFDETNIVAYNPNEPSGSTFDYNKLY